MLGIGRRKTRTPPLVPCRLRFLVLLGVVLQLAFLPWPVPKPTPAIATLRNISSAQAAFSRTSAADPAADTRESGRKDAVPGD